MKVNKMGFFDIIGIFKPIKRHFKTLKEDCSFLILLTLFVFIPIGISALLTFLWDIVISDTYINYLIATFAIFIGFFISTLILLLDRKKDTDDTENKLIIHTSYNSVYAIILGIFLLLFALLISFIFDVLKQLSLELITFFFNSLLVHYIITLLMISRRLYYTVFIKSKEWGFEDSTKKSKK